MDILASTETSEKEDIAFFLHNIEIEGYENYHTPTKTSIYM